MEAPSQPKEISSAHSSGAPIFTNIANRCTRSGVRSQGDLLLAQTGVPSQGTSRPTSWWVARRGQGQTYLKPYHFLADDGRNPFKVPFVLCHTRLPLQREEACCFQGRGGEAKKLSLPSPRGFAASTVHMRGSAGAKSGISDPRHHNKLHPLLAASSARKPQEVGTQAVPPAASQASCGACSRLAYPLMQACQ